MEKIKIEFDEIEWDNNSAGMLVKRFSQAGKQTSPTRWPAGSEY